MHPLYGHKEDTHLSEGYTLTIEMDFSFLTARVFFVLFQISHLSSTVWQYIFREVMFTNKPWYPLNGLIQNWERSICQGCILSSCLFNLYAEYIMQNARLDDAHAGIKISGRNIKRAQICGKYI